VEWIYLAQNVDKRQIVVNTVWTLRFYKMREIHWLIEEVLTCQERLCSLELE
jgi:hypothetical protein